MENVILKTFQSGSFAWMHETDNDFFKKINLTKLNLRSFRIPIVRSDRSRFCSAHFIIGFFCYNTEISKRIVCPNENYFWIEPTCAYQFVHVYKCGVCQHSNQSLVRMWARIRRQTKNTHNILDRCAQNYRMMSYFIPVCPTFLM